MKNFLFILGLLCVTGCVSRHDFNALQKRVGELEKNPFCKIYFTPETNYFYPSNFYLKNVGPVQLENE